MDPFPIVQTIAFSLFALCAVWLLAAALGIDLRALALRRRVKRADSDMLLCGACGHPAVSLGEISRCPECGAGYRPVGLDGRFTAARWSPPLPVVAALLLGLITIASVRLAPSAAMWANRAATGSPSFERVVSTTGFAPTEHAATSGIVPGFALEFDTELLLPNAWRSDRSAGAIDRGQARVRLIVGKSVALTTRTWDVTAQFLQSKGAVDTGERGLIARAYPSSIGGRPAGMETYELLWQPGTPAWTIVQRDGGVLEEGEGLDAGVAALFTHASNGAALASAPPFSDAHKRITTDIARAADAAERPGMSSSLLPPFSGLSIFGQDERPAGVVVLHRAAPWGVVAASGVSLGLLVIAAIIFWLAWRRGRAWRSRAVG